MNIKKWNIVSFVWYVVWYYVNMRFFFFRFEWKDLSWSWRLISKDL